MKKMSTIAATIRGSLKVIDLCFSVLAALAAGVAKVQWRFGPENLPRSFRAWDATGVAPVPLHFYHPAFDPDSLPETVWTREDRLLGIDLQVEKQLQLLSQFRYADELQVLPLRGDPKDGFCYFNRMFGPGDAEILYSMIRHLKPHKTVEIGSGCSTLLAKAALDRNRAEGNATEHICIEPYPPSWFDEAKVTRLIRTRVETIEPAFFEQLQENDILFIDSSHVLRIGGDVWFEYLEILPRLRRGVFVHIHDIFLPFEYPRPWVRDRRWYWTEQHLVQAFLAFNSAFEVVLALSYLNAHHRQALACVAPTLVRHTSSRPASLWIRRKL
jgi:Methyltransferase domain